ncbi:unnamed protein product [Ectocarpus sp. 8 AP-2014]
MAEDNQTSQDGLIHRVCVEGKGAAQSVATMTRAQRCEYAGCDGTPRYGPRNGPRSFCQGHKRAGMYTYRSGELFMATRDGRVFRKAAGTTATAAAKPVVSEPASRPVQNRDETAPAAAAAATNPAPPQEATTMPPARGSDKPQQGRSDREEKGVVSLKNGACVFPGTSRESRPHIAAKTARVEPKNESEQAAAPEEKPAGAEEGGGAKREEDNSNKGELSAEGKSAARKAKEPKRAATAAGLPSSSTLSYSPRSSSGRQTSPLSRMAEAPGLTPSDEMRLLQEARDSARAAAEASGCGRRARAPSRKFLEASGKMVGESAQWMTREKKEEQARLSLTLKEQRKAAAAAGLKPGEVIEAATVAVAGGDGSRGENAPSNGSWRKLTPAEILQAAGKTVGVGKAKNSLPGSTDTKRVTTEKQREGPATEAETGRRLAKRRCSSASEVASESKRGRHPKGKAPGGGSWRGAAGSKD